MSAPEGAPTKASGLSPTQTAPANTGVDVTDPDQIPSNSDDFTRPGSAEFEGSTSRIHYTHGPVTFEPIGWVCSPYQRRFGTPQQAAAVDSDAEAVLKLDPDRIPLAALVDLAGMERVWVLSYLDRGAGWSAEVVPPRGPRVQRGLFATRSPDRPNPIGLSALRLVRVEGWDLHVRGIDLLDGTPILDIKPYIPYCDAFPNAKAGWVDELPAGSLQYAKR